jgi:hypothetical protein
MVTPISVKIGGKAARWQTYYFVDGALEMAADAMYVHMCIIMFLDKNNFSFVFGPTPIFSILLYSQ